MYLSLLYKFNIPHPLAFFFPFGPFPPLPLGFGVFFPSLLGSKAFVLVLFSGLTLLLLLLLRLRLLERDRLLLLSFLLRVTGGDLLLEGCHLGSFLSSWGDLLRLFIGLEENVIIIIMIMVTNLELREGVESQRTTTHVNISFH